MIVNMSTTSDGLRVKYDKLLRVLHNSGIAILYVVRSILLFYCNVLYFYG